jgi:hypothetical protein
MRAGSAIVGDLGPDAPQHIFPAACRDLCRTGRLAAAIITTIGDRRTNRTAQRRKVSFKLLETGLATHGG